MNRLILRTLGTCVALASAAAGVEANNEPPLTDKTLIAETAGERAAISRRNPGYSGRAA